MNSTFTSNLLFNLLKKKKLKINLKKNFLTYSLLVYKAVKTVATEMKYYTETTSEIL